ncbi:MAG: hypothetical protein A2W03_07245 [Candidatus Aminicenantes bacterium RBG_16_63_16]|nr:MAG: hypothetical protein A2W03_07245 [Candidatus Aminicenantes bacterium RBG_16_63_16]
MPAPEGSGNSKVDTDYGKIPVYFIINQGQMDDQVAYYVQGKDKSLYFTADGVTIALTKAAAIKAAPSESGPGKINPSLYEKNVSPLKHPSVNGTERWVVKLDFVGAAKGVKPVGEDETGAVVSYFKGKPKDWKTGLPTYSKIVYRDLWPGIDLVYQGTINRLKYEFIVRPGADPARIRLACRGADSLSVDDAGRLNVVTPLGGFQDDIPDAYQEKEGKRTHVSLAYELAETSLGRYPDSQDRSQNQESCRAYSFRVGDYNPELPLILDPAILVYCGFIGGSARDQASAIAADALGNAYLTGTTWSAESTFPASTGPDLTFNGGTDAFIAKVNPAGSALIYCGYIGGDSIESLTYSGFDHGYGIAVDSAGNAYATGSTSSSEATFPVTVGPDLTYNGSRHWPDKTSQAFYDDDAFVAKINASGTALVYCGYIGGAGMERGVGIAVDAGGNALVSGYTDSTEATFPITVGPDVTYNGGGDAFVAKVNATGTALSYCGYAGGSGYDSASGIAVDAPGNGYLIGSTESSQTTFPVLAGPGLTYRGNSDAFVAKIDVSGISLAYCGYIGGYNEDYGAAIAVDRSGSAYLVGSTTSFENSFPATVGPDLTLNGFSDAFVAKVKPAGTALLFCGYIGGFRNDYGYGIAVDGSGNAYVAGKTFSVESSFPVREGPDLTFNNPFNPASPVSDSFVARVNSIGTGLIYCGYIGGLDNDSCNGIAVDGYGNAYVTGTTRSNEATFPVAVGPDLSFNGSSLADDAFVAKITYWESWSPKQAVGDFDGDGRQEVAVDFGATGTWIWDGGSWSVLTGLDPEGMLAADVNGDGFDEIVLSFRAAGIWIVVGGVGHGLSAASAEGMVAGDVDADGAAEVAVDFGQSGLWLFDGGTWLQLSGANAEHIVIVNLDGSGGAEIVGDLGPMGLWLWTAGAWSELAGTDVDGLASGNTGGTPYLVGDFWGLGMWLWTAGGGWVQLSGAAADSVITADIDGNGDDEIVGDFGILGPWRLDNVADNGASWTRLAWDNPELMVPADIDGGGVNKIVADFGSLGIWLWTGSVWAQLRDSNPDYIWAGDFDGDGRDEVMADLGAAGLWLWNDGAWSIISSSNPD